MPETQETLPEQNLANSYELGVDMRMSDNKWQRIRFILSADPQFTAKTVDAATYEDKGSDNQMKIGESGVLNLNVQQIRSDTDGLFLPEVEELLDAAAPDSLGSKAVREFRYYDMPASGDPNPNYAYQFKATVSETRGASGVAETGAWNFVLTAQGPRKRITNPLITEAE